MWRLDDLRARVRAADPVRFDAALAALFAVAAAAESFLTSHDVGQDRALSALLGALALAPLAWRRRAPLVATLAFAAISVAQIPLDVLYPETTPFIAIFLLLYTLGRYATGVATWAGALSAFATVVAIGVTSPDDLGVEPFEVVWLVALMGAPVLAGRAMRDRLRLQRELRETAARLEAGKELRAQRAVDAERARLAGELQAVVANAVSAIVLQAEGTVRILDAGEPGRAGEPLAVIEDTGRDALAEMRRLLGVLRRPGDGGALAPQPSLAEAQSLVERLRADGAPISLQVSGERRDLPAGIELAAYRVLQEALASSSQAAGVSEIVVELGYGERLVTVAVRDDRPAGDGPDEQALTALRERVRLYGGVLRTEHDAGFGLTARLPTELPA